MTSDSAKPLRLDVYLYDKYIGQLCSHRAVLSFAYDAKYLEDPKALLLSQAMPLQSTSFKHEVCAPFFSGLLPDEIIRVRLARYLGLSAKNTFALLKEIGGECAGAVSLYVEGSDPHQLSEPTYRILETVEANQILLALDKHPLMAGGEIRISGAGAQDKLMIAFVDGKIAIPLKNTASTHIIKPSIKGLEDSVRNEFFCMSLAKSIGLSVPTVQILTLETESYYVVERYDRQIKADIVTRLHQEDFCQMMHIPPEMKYENEGGPTLINCFDLLKQRIASGAMAGKNKIELFKAVLFNFLIGNGDAHGKNYSILYFNDGESLAPLYDLMCTSVYSNYHKSKMAMKLNGKYKFKNIALSHFERLGESIGFKLDFTHQLIKQITTVIESKATELNNEFNKNLQTKSSIYSKIISVINQHNLQISL
ncbi:MAG: serine/threonine-protein kinase HipA [Candidatus Omnitrophota bacterium]|jgi:serine/threonine-protein kinase HipA